MIADNKEGRSAPGGRREQAKEERRLRIVAAARDLMIDVGVEAMSMKQVSTRAGVSLQTVYNLFESKDAVLARVFEESFGHYLEAMTAMQSKDPLERIFDAVDVAARIYDADPDFYRSSVWLVGRDSNVKLSMQQPRVQFFCDLVAGARQAGCLTRDAEPSTLGACCIVPMFSAAFQAWASGQAPIDEFRARAKFGIAVVLKAYCAPKERARIDALAKTFQAWLLEVI